MSRYPSRPRFNPKDSGSGIDARLAWRASLSDQDVRAMAADYWRGDRDQCSIDAWEEYQHRWPKELEHKSPGKVRKGRKGRKA